MHDRQPSHRFRFACFWLVIVALLSAASIEAQREQRNDLTASIDAIAQQALKEGPIAGLSIAVARGPRLILAKGYGYADLENDVPATAETVYRIGSITKQFTAVLIMQLVEAGKLSLDDPLTRFLPDYPTHGHRITIHHLLNHTSGIKSYTGLGPKLWQTTFRLDLSHQELIDLFKNEPLDFPPGQGYAYNNSAYYLLGVIIEKVTGMNYADVVEKRIFGPLGMSGSHYCRQRPLIKHRARGYQVMKGTLVNAPPISMRIPGAAGGLCSTVLDLVKWQRALIEHRLIGRASYERLITPTRLADGVKVSYGFGLAMTELGGHRRIGHGGSVNGFTGVTWYYPDDDLTTVVLTNTGGSRVTPAQIEERIARAILNLPEPEIKDIALSSEERRRYVGTYAVGSQRITVSDEGGKLVLKQGPGPGMTLLYQGNDIFVSASNPRLQLEFHVRGERVSGFTFKPGGVPIYVARRVATSRSAVEPFDLLIRGGTVVDGTGAPRFKADIGIRGGRIIFIGTARDRTARDTIEAAGLIVAPGFIDVHNHTARAIAHPDKRWNEGFIRQGVTTIVGGPDGSLEPAEMKRLIAAYERNGIGTNVAFYVGHNAIRRRVMGMARRAPTPAELAQMKALVREGMELGAVGLSTGLMYPPGMFSDTDEVVALAREVAPYHGIYDSHVRDPVHALLASDKEAIEIGERAGIPVKIAHLKAVGLHNQGAIKQVIALIEEARARGVNVVSDQYPYDGAATATLRSIIVVPDDLKRRPNFDLKAALRDPHERQRLKRASEEGIDGGFAWLKATGYTSIRITSSTDYPQLVGKYLSQLAEERGVDGFQVISDLILEATAPIGITLGAIKEADVRQLMVQPWNMIASDGGYVDSHSRGNGHPRSTGTFPRVLGRYVRQLGLLKLEEAIRKMTSLPAEFLGFRDRGRIAVGWAADITIFDPQTIIDRSTWDQPHLLAEGVRHVLVNGIPVLRDGQLTGHAPGRFLPKPRSPQNPRGERH